jgi:hypothetical protein
MTDIVFAKYVEIYRYDDRYDKVDITDRNEDMILNDRLLQYLVKTIFSGNKLF